jgi:hypothetical protein
MNRVAWLCAAQTDALDGFAAPLGDGAVHFRYFLAEHAGKLSMNREGPDCTRNGRILPPPFSRGEMMSRSSRPVKKWLTYVIALAAISLVGSADCRAGDSATIHAWRRTFHGPNVLATPLRGYFIPRRPTCLGAGMGFDYTAGAGPCESPQPQSWLEPAAFERLGQIPNEFAVDSASVRP